MTSQIATVPNLIERLPQRVHIEEAPQHSEVIGYEPRLVYVSDNPSLSDLLFGGDDRTPDVARAKPQRPLRSRLVAGMTAVRAVFRDYGQKVWHSGKQVVKKRHSREFLERPTIDWQRFSQILREEAESARTTRVQNSETERDTVEDRPEVIVPADTDYAVMPHALGQSIISAWAIISEESRALGIPLQGDTAGYLQSKTEKWGWDKAETDELQHKYATVLASYGTMPKDVGYAWIHSTLLYHEGEDVAATHQSIRDEMTKWGWNGAAAAAMFGEIAKEKHAETNSAEPPRVASPKPPVESTPEPQVVASPVPAWKPVSERSGPQSPERVAAASIGGGDSGGIPPRPTTSRDPEGWRKWLPLGFAGAIVLSIVGLVMAGSGTSRGPGTDLAPTVPPPSATGEQTPGAETPGSDEGDDDGENTSDAKYTEGTKQMLKIREAKDGRLFVDATPWASPRSTYWGAGGEQIQANEGRKPTMREYVFVKNALLRVNHETEASARRMQVGHDIFMLTATQYDAAMEKAHA